MWNYLSRSFFSTIINRTLGNKILIKKPLALDNGDEIMLHEKINHVFKVLKFALFLMSKKYYSTYSSYTIICCVIYTAESFRNLLNLLLYKSEKISWATDKLLKGIFSGRIVVRKSLKIILNFKF